MLRAEVHRLLFQPSRATIDRAVNGFIVALILANVLAMVLESVASIRVEWHEAFEYFEAFSVAIFLFEYILRAWSWRPEDGSRWSVGGLLRYLVSPFPLIDLFAVLPWFLPFLGADLRVLRMMRIARIFRIAKLGRYSRSMGLIWEVVRTARYELSVTISVGAMLLILASSGIYYAEFEAQPEVFASIPHSAWWAVATLTTVGYGDIYPVTPLGKVFGAAIAIIGIGLFGLPTAILAGAFTDVFRARREKEQEEREAAAAGPKAAAD